MKEISKRQEIDGVYGGDEERVLLSGSRRTYPGLEITYLREEGWEKGRVYVSVCRDSDCMTIDQFEVFIATFRKVVDIAHRKEAELGAHPDDLPCKGEMPQVEMSYDSVSHDNILYNVNDLGGIFGVATAEKFIILMEGLLAEGRKIQKLQPAA